MSSSAVVVKRLEALQSDDAKERTGRETYPAAVNAVIDELIAAEKAGFPLP